MILDVNVLVNALRRDALHHRQATAYLAMVGANAEVVGWHPGLHAALLRVTTGPKFFDQPSTRQQCCEFLDTLTALPGAIRVSEGSSFWPVFTNLLNKYNAVGPSISDFYWAALAIDNSAALCSADQKFGQIKELRWHNLLDYAGS